MTTSREHTSSTEGSIQHNGTPVQIIRMKEVIRRVGLSRSTIWRLERTGKFPRRRRLGPNSIGWLLSEVDDWIATRTSR